MMLSTLQKKKKLYSAISKLPKGYIEPMVLRYIKGEPTNRIAKSLGISIESVDSRLLRAMSRLHSLMEDSGSSDIAQQEQ